MPASLETRRRAVSDALRALAVEARLDAASAQIAEVMARLNAVETALLEAAWERPAAAHVAPAPVPAYCSDDSGEGNDDERISVPAVPLGEVKMSSVAAEALFGG